MQLEQTAVFSMLVLCGGQSRRMGRDKALLELDGLTLLERCKNLGAELGATQILISRNQPGFITDLVQDAGPMAGIAAALPHCNSHWLLVLPIDMPLLTAAALTPLLQYAFLQQRGCFFAEYPLPVVLAVSDELRQLLDQQLLNPAANRALHRAWTKLDLAQLQLQVPDAFQNCNDPASFAQIKARQQADKGNCRMAPEALISVTGEQDDHISQ